MYCIECDVQYVKISSNFIINNNNYFKNFNKENDNNTWNTVVPNDSFNLNELKVTVPGVQCFILHQFINTFKLINYLKN